MRTPPLLALGLALLAGLIVVYAVLGPLVLGAVHRVRANLVTGRLIDLEEAAGPWWDPVT
jgi:hypothetical protein